MSDAESIITTTSAPPPPSEDSAPAEPPSQTQEPKKLPNSALTFSIWPPSQRTRDAVVSRLIETLSTPSVLSKRYGTLPQEEAADAARRIEDEAFGVAGAAVSAEEDGIEILQLYSKEISRRMLEIVKARAASGSTVDNKEGSSEEVASPVEIEA